MTVSAPPDALARLLDRAGLGGPFAATRLAGGGNNRAHRVDRPGAAPLFLKEYFRHPSDRRDRLASEFGFLTFARAAGIDSVPAPVAASPEDGLALYEYVDGEPVRPEDVGSDAVGAALALLARLDERRADPLARALPLASEAAFSIAGHLGVVGRRLDRLASIDPTSPVDREAARFVEGELVPAWRGVAARVRSSGLPLDAELSEDDRILSPSDFGFHNAIRRRDGRLVFVDFEYAGWDDPAKTAGDFFSQVARPVPIDFLDAFLETVSPLHAPRIRLLLPVYRVKWCAILLNEFRTDGGARRVFAGRAEDLEERKAAQLEKARLALTRIPA